ncbi:hypothetical protein LTR37_010835 [Vermiconidia calcicola]|uniref:Uncharacterized protein n=1 Tax=Vermiconidia calcicola TaxID=1690605 RepID=A0ACC3N415_9PEZI|nr:hypothetical protein LTR37_010835 [Vermiconidia calcicola]
MESAYPTDRRQQLVQLVKSLVDTEIPPGDRYASALDAVAERENIREQVRENHLDNRAKRKARYDNGIRAKRPTPDDIVFIENPKDPKAKNSAAAWSRVEQVYNNREEFLKSKRALHIAVRRLTLKAWDAYSLSNNVPEPSFIKSLLSLQRVHSKRGTQGQNSDAASLKMTMNTPPAIDPALVGDSNAASHSLSGDVGHELGDDFDLDTVDWNFWDQLIQEYQAQGDQQ